MQAPTVPPVQFPFPPGAPTPGGLFTPAARQPPPMVSATGAPIFTGGTISNPPPAALGRGGVSPLPAMLPELQVYQCGFRLIPVPAGLAFPANSAAYFKLFSLDAANDQEVGLNSIQMELLPTDSTAGGIPGRDPGDIFIPWGNKWGTGAAIVVGIDLPGELGQWSPGPADELGILDGDTAPPARTLITPNVANQRIAVQSFPAGTLADNTPWKQNVGRAYGMSIGRIGAGRRLDVALVVNPADVDDAAVTAAGGSPAFLAGLARIGLHCLALEYANPTVS